MSEERTPAVQDSEVEGTPAPADTIDSGTPENANPAEPQEEGQPETAETPTPGVQDTSDNRYKSLQSQFTKVTQENARLKQLLTPDVVAAIQTGQQQNADGRDILRKKLEANPQIIDDPVTNIMYHQNMTQAQVEAILNERDAKIAFAEKAKKLPAFKDVDLSDPEIDTAYKHARAVLMNSGKATENPFILAMAFARPQKIEEIMSGREQKMKEAEQRQVATRLDKPGVPKAPTVQKDEVVSIDDYFRISAARHLQNPPVKVGTIK